MTPTHITELLQADLHITTAFGFLIGGTGRGVIALPWDERWCQQQPLTFTPPLRGPSFQTACNRSTVVIDHGGQWDGWILDSLDLTGRGPDGERLSWWIRFLPPGIPCGPEPLVLPPGGLQIHAALDGALIPGTSPQPRAGDRHTVPGWSSRYFIYGTPDPTDGLGEEAVLYLDRQGRVAGVEAARRRDPAGNIDYIWWELIGTSPECPGTETVASGKQQHAHPA